MANAVAVPRITGTPGAVPSAKTNGRPRYGVNGYGARTPAKTDWISRIAKTTKTRIKLPLVPRTVPPHRRSAPLGPEVRMSTSSSRVKSTEGVTSPS